MTARTLINVPAKAKRGEIIEIKTLISHPMESGFRVGFNGALIPRDTFAATTPLREIDRWADEEVELAQRHLELAHEEVELASRRTERAGKRRRYVDGLIKAINGDLDVTLGEAEHRLHDGDD